MRRRLLLVLLQLAPGWSADCDPQKWRCTCARCCKVKLSAQDCSACVAQHQKACAPLGAGARLPGTKPSRGRWACPFHKAGSDTLYVTVRRAVVLLAALAFPSSLSGQRVTRQQYAKLAAKCFIHHLHA